MRPENFTQPSYRLHIKYTGRKLCICVQMQGQSCSHEPFFFFLKIKLLATKSDQQREKCRHCKERSIDEHKIPFLLESEWLLPYPRYSVFSLRLLLLSEIFLFVRTETFLLVIVSPASGRPPGRADPLRNTDRIDENTAPYLH